MPDEPERKHMLLPEMLWAHAFLADRGHVHEVSDMVYVPGKDSFECTLCGAGMTRDGAAALAKPRALPNPAEPR